MSTTYSSPDPTGAPPPSTTTYKNTSYDGSLISILLIALADLILAAGLVLGIFGYYGITDRLDDIKAQLPPVSISTPTPTPTDTPTPTPTQPVPPAPSQ